MLKTVEQVNKTSALYVTLLDFNSLKDNIVEWAVKSHLMRGKIHHSEQILSQMDHKEAVELFSFFVTCTFLMS